MSIAIAREITTPGEAWAGKTNVTGWAQTVQPKLAGFPVLPTPPVGWIALGSDTGLVVAGRLNGPAKRADIQTGLEEVERPKNKPAVDWVAGELERWEVPFLLDAWKSGGDIEAPLAVLIAMTTVATGKDAPPRIRTAGVPQISGVPHTREWYIESIAWSDDPEPLWRPHRARARQAADLTLVEALPPDVITVRAAKAARDRNGKAKPRTYIVRAGDTLQIIALHELGSAGRWREIAKLNKLRDGRNLTRGQKLKLP